MTRHDLPPAAKDRLRKVEALIARGATAGERAAALEARNRIYRTHGIDPAAAASQHAAQPGYDSIRRFAEREAMRREAENRAAMEAMARAARAAEDLKRAAQRKADAAFLARPSNQRILGLIRLHGRAGISAEKIGETLGWQIHTVRAAISRLRKAGAPVTRYATGLYSYGKH